MKIKVEYDKANFKVENKAIRVLRVAPFGLPDGIQDDAFQNAGEILVGLGAGLYAALTPPAVSGKALLSDMGEAAKVIWGTPALTGIPDTGWSPAGVTWTYVAANQFKVIGADLTAAYTKGTKFKCTQASVNYFYCLGSSLSGSDTVVTITGGSTYSLTNASITEPYYSYVENPQGFPGSFAYTPAWTSSGTPPAIGDGVLGGRFSINGTWLDVTAYLMVGTTTTYGTGVYYLSMPMTPSNTSIGMASAYDISSTFRYNANVENSGNTMFAFATGNYWGPTVPFTWAIGDVLRMVE